MSVWKNGLQSWGRNVITAGNEVWGKVIFSVACVKNSVQRGGGGIPACLAGGIPACLAGLQEGGSPGPHPGGSPGPHLEGGWCIPACTEADPCPADRYCCTRYASYWNAFLLWYAAESLHGQWSKREVVFEKNGTHVQWTLIVWSHLFASQFLGRWWEPMNDILSVYECSFIS